MKRLISTLALMAAWMIVVISIQTVALADGDEILVQDSSADVGETVEMEIDISNEVTPVDAFGFTLMYDDGLLTFLSCSTGDVFPGSGWDQFSYSAAVPGRIAISGSHDSLAVPAGSSGTIARLFFTWNMYNGWWCETNLVDLQDDLEGFSVRDGEFEVTA